MKELARIAGALGFAICAGGLLVACAESDPAVLPRHGFVDAAVSKPENASHLPVSTRNTANSSLSDIIAMEASLTTATCGFVELTASRPKRIRGTECQEEYLVDLAVEADVADAGLLDMFRSYDIVDWRLRAVGGRTKHEVSLLWRPYRDARYSEGVSDRVFDVRNITQPLTVGICPEGSGAVLACSDTACELYESEDQVPRVDLPTQDAVVETPWSYDEAQDLREGSTLTVRVPYFLRTRQSSLTIQLYRSRRRSSREFDIVPHRHEIRNSRGFGTVTFRITADRDGIAQDASVEEFRLGVGYDGPRAGCIVFPTPFQVRVRNR